MALGTANDARIDVRLPSELMGQIERAAARRGQSVGDFAVDSLARAARGVNEWPDATELSDRDRDIFTALLDDAEARPNDALQAAAERYKRHLGRTDG